MLRHNPFRSHDDAVCIAALTAPRPWPGRTTMRSRLAETVSRLAATTGRPTSAVAAEWFLRYLEHVVLPVLAFDALAGIALEAHQQNTLVLLDPAGWPVGGRYRDNQGYYFRASRRAELERRLPGIGSASDTFVSDAVTDERFAYYLGINNVLGLIGAFDPSGSPTSASCSPPSAGSSARPRTRTAPRTAARLTRSALQGKSAHPPGRPRRARRTRGLPVRLRHPHQPLHD